MITERGKSRQASDPLATTAQEPKATLATSAGQSSSIMQPHATARFWLPLKEVSVVSSVLIIPPTPGSAHWRPSSLKRPVDTPNWRQGGASLAPDARQQIADLHSIAFRRAYAHRLCTGSVYHAQPRSTYSVLVVRSPRFSARPFRYQNWAPGLAPHADLEAAYAAGRLSWDAFAHEYLARLRAFPWKLAEARAQVATVLSRYRTVTLLGLERSRDETTVRCHRRLLRAWLLGEPVEEVPDAQ